MTSIAILIDFSCCHVESSTTNKGKTWPEKPFGKERKELFHRIVLQEWRALQLEV